MPRPEPCAASFFDGVTAIRHAVTLRLSADGMALDITADTLDAPLCWPVPDLRALQEAGSASQMVLTRHAESGDESPRDPARLVIEDPTWRAWLTRTRPNLYRKDLRKGTARRIAVTLGSAVAAVVALVFVILPAMANTLAGLIPLDREIAFGKAVTAQMERVLGGSEIGALRCNSAEGRAALERLTARLLAGQSIDYDLDVVVFDHDMVNAFAAPGGQIVLMRGLLEQAAGPDAVAAVLAHEIGHVVARDATRLALRTVGSAGLISMVLGDVTGGTVLVLVGEQMLDTSYTREAEAAADRYALDMMNAAGIDTAALADFFDTMAQQQDGFALPEILSSHPDTGDRAGRARVNSATQGTTSPALDAAAWQALRSICA